MPFDEGYYYGNSALRLSNVDSRKRKKDRKRNVSGRKCSHHPHIFRCFSTTGTRPCRSGHPGNRCRHHDQQDTRGRGCRCSTSLDDAIGRHAGYPDPLCRRRNANNAHPARHIDRADLPTSSPRDGATSSDHRRPCTGTLPPGCWHQSPPRDGKHIWPLDAVSTGVFA